MTDNYRKFLNPRMSHIFDKTFVLCIFCSKYSMNNDRIFKEEESERRSTERRFARF